MLDSVEQQPVTVGDWVFVKRLREDTPYGDIVERVGWVLASDAGHWTVTFGKLLRFIRYPKPRDTYRLVPVKLLDGGFPAGPNGGQMIPPARLVKINDERYGKCLALCEGKWESLWADIEANGMRHPPVVDERLMINAGLSRIYAHHKAGAEFVECYIVDVDAREL